MSAQRSRCRELWQTTSVRRAPCAVDVGVCVQRRVDGVVQCSRGTAARALPTAAANRARRWAKKYEHGAHHLVLYADVRYRGRCGSMHYPSGFPTPSSANWGALNVQETSRSPLNARYEVRSFASSPVAAKPKNNSGEKALPHHIAKGNASVRPARGSMPSRSRITSALYWRRARPARWLRRLNSSRTSG